jgi:ABC-type nitrate/sulfonate/bicarbonate transport system substrate-binding protein
MISFLTIVLVTTPIVICPSGEIQGAAAQKKLIISHSGMNARYAHLWIAQEWGFFPKYGIDTDVVFVRSGPI